MFFTAVPEGAPDPVFGLAEAFRKDPRLHTKVDLTAGIYKDDQLRARLMPAVLKAKQAVMARDALADYLPIDGLLEFCEEVGKLLFGPALWGQAHEKIYAAGVAGGTAALRVAAELIVQEVTKTIFIPDPTWPNHRQIFERAGCQVATYPYYNRQEKRFDCDAMCLALQSLPAKTAILLHAACHNPSGCDPTSQQWERIAHIVRVKQLLPLLDCAYHGLGEGLDPDAGAIRWFLEHGQEMIIAYSCSKNFSLYCQRTGALFIVGEDTAVKQKVGSQVKRIIRALYSNPPAHGEHIVIEILKNPPLRKEWDEQLSQMRQRIVQMRESLIARLIAGAQKTDFRYLRHRKGLFMLLDLTKPQIQRMKDQFATYLLDSGRITVTGLTTDNLEFVEKTFLTVIES